MANGGYIKASLVSSVSGSWDAAFPVANLSDYSGTKPARYNASSLSVTVTASASTCNGIAVCNHNLPDGATVTIDSTAYTASAGKSIWHKFASPKNSATVAISGGPAKICIGEIVMGPLFTFTDNYANNWTEEASYVNDLAETEYGAIVAYGRYYGRSIQLPFNNVTSTTATQIQSLYNELKGGKTPFLLIPDTAAQDCLYGRLVNNCAVSHPFYGRYVTVMQFREEATAVTLL